MKMAFARNLIHSCRALFTTIATGEGKYILALPLIASLYYALTQPVTFDEAWRYLRFTTTPAEISLEHYPGINHLLLFSLLASVIDTLPGMIPLFVLRLPSVMAAVLTWSLLYTAIKQQHSVQAALVTTGIASTLFMSVYYSYIATRYMWVVLFFVIAAIATWQLITGNRAFYTRLLYVIACILGCALMPAFVLPVIAFSIMLIITRGLPGRQWWQYHLVIGVAVAAFYLLISLFRGVPNVFDMHWASVMRPHLYGEKISSFWYQTLSDITGLLGALLFVFILAACIYAMVRKKFQLLGMIAIFLVVPVIALWMQSVLAYPETFVYYGCAVAFLIAFPHFEWLSRIPMRWSLVLAIGLQVLLLFFFQQRIHKLDHVYAEFHTAFEQLGEAGNNYFICSELFGGTFLFEMKQRNFSTDSIAQHIPDISHPVSADTITGYDYIILDKDIDQTKQKPPVFSGERIAIYH